jgi:hypothetical protein
VNVLVGLLLPEAKGILRSTFTAVQ